MSLIFGILLAVCIFVLPDAITNSKLDHYDVSKIDNVKLTRDMVNGVSVSERRRRCVNGYYDKKQKNKMQIFLTLLSARILK